VDGQTIESSAFVGKGIRRNDGKNVCGDGAKSSRSHYPKFTNLKEMILVAAGKYASR
jgi:hypothetical protein